MANNGSGVGRIAKTASYICLLTAAAIIVLNFVLGWIMGEATGGVIGTIMKIAAVIEKVCFCIGIGICAFDFAAARKKPVWMILFWIAIVIYLGFGMFGIFW